jgi:hypothetical protein
MLLVGRAERVASPQSRRASSAGGLMIAPLRHLTVRVGIIFGLFVAFTAAQVWTDNEKARMEIDREASALRSAAILATSFPKESQVQLSELIRRYQAVKCLPNCLRKFI